MRSGPSVPPSRDAEVYRRQLETIAENATLALFIMDEHQQCTFMNAAAERLTGYTLDEVQGRTLHDVVHHTHPDGTPFPIEDCPIDRAFPQNMQEQGEEVFVHKDGSFYPVAFTASPIRQGARTVGTIIEVRGIQGEIAEREERARMDAALGARTRTLEIFNRVNAQLASDASLEAMVQTVTDAGTELTGAQFGAFFYNVIDDNGEAFTLYTLSGAPREAFSRFPHPRATDVFRPTFVGEGIIRSDDVTQDPRYGHNAPYYGMPKGHLPVRSYLAVPVRAPSGEVLGGLFFGHAQPGVFTADAEALVSSIADQAAIAIDKARSARLVQRALADADAERRLLRAVLEAIPVGVVITNADGGMRHINAEARRQWGTDTPMATSTDDYQAYHGHWSRNGAPVADDEWPMVRALKEGVTTLGETIEIEGSDGMRRAVLLSAAPVLDSSGGIQGAVAAQLDVTERERLERALVMAHAQLEAVYETAPAGLAIHDRDLRFVRVNEQMAAINGVAVEDQLGKTLREVLGESLADQVEPLMQRVMETGEPVLGVEISGRTAAHPDEERTWVLSWTPLWQGEAVTGVNVAALEITDLKKTAAALREREDRYRLIADATFDVIWDWNLVTDFVDWNPSIADRFGWTEAVEGTTGDWWKARLHPDDAERVVHSIHHIIDEGGTHWQVPYRFRCADGVYAEVLDRGRVLRGDDGAPIRMIGAMVDLTALREAERALRESESRFRALVAASAQIVWATDADGAVVEDSPSWRAFTGQSREDWNGYGWVNVLHPDDRARAEQAWRAAVRKQASYTVEYRLRRHDGEYRWTLARGVPVLDAEGAIREWVGMNTDITDQKEAADALRASEELFRLALDAADVAAFDWDLDTNLAGGDARFNSLIGLTGTRLVDVTEVFATRMSEAEAASVQAAIARGFETGRYSTEVRLLPPEGGYADGRPYRWIAAQGLIRYEGEEAERRPCRIVGTVRDITEEREAEEQLRGLNTALQNLNAELEARVEARTQELQEANRVLGVRNRELQDFAYVASHDLQEPLRKIQSFAGLLLMEASDVLPGETRGYVERMQAAAARMSGLIRDLLAFSRVATQGQPEQQVDLNETLREVLTDLGLRLDETGGRVEVPSPLPTLAADPTQMHQLFQNLIGNALKFHREGVPPLVQITWQPVGAGLQLRVQDNGIGFESKYAERIFAPFQRLHTRQAFEGTGMGLAIVRRIVERHGWNVEASSTPDAGSLFTITVPGA